MTMHGTNERGGEQSLLRARTPARWSRAPNVLDRPTRQGVMVLPPEGAAVLLTGVAARVWEALDQPLAGDQLADRLAHPSGGAGSGAGTRGARPGPGRPGAAVAGAASRPSLDQVAAALSDLRAIGAVREIR